MKINKVFGKSQIAITAMVLALAVAIWLNMQFSDTSTKYLGEATYVNNTSSSADATQTSAKAPQAQENYFDTVRKQREDTQKQIEETVEETLKSENLTDEDKKGAVESVQKLLKRIEQESNIEALIKAKGFAECVAIISDDGISVVVKSDGLTTAQTLQIQDIATSQTEIELGKVKIVTVK